MLPDWITWGSAGLLTFFITLHFVEGFDRRFLRRGTMAGKGMELIVEGMTCSHCVRTVTDALKSVPGVTRVEVTLATGRALVEGENLDREKLSEAVKSAGYGVKG
jgi:copper chaperone CopZ